MPTWMLLRSDSWDCEIDFSFGDKAPREVFKGGLAALREDCPLARKSADRSQSPGGEEHESSSISSEIREQ